MGRQSNSLTVSGAIKEAIALEMESNERVLVLGEDVATYGGVFGATDGQLKVCVAGSHSPTQSA